MKYTQDEIGDAGEEHFRTLARRARFLCHPPESDRRGWDFLLELPVCFGIEAENPSFFHKPTAGHRPWVQAKTTKKLTKSSWGVSANHLKRFIQDIEPVFFFSLMWSLKSLLN